MTETKRSDFYTSSLNEYSCDECTAACGHPMVCLLLQFTVAVLISYLGVVAIFLLKVHAFSSFLGAWMFQCKHLCSETSQVAFVSSESLSLVPPRGC